MTKGHVPPGSSQARLSASYPKSKIQNPQSPLSRSYTLKRPAAAARIDYAAELNPEQLAAVTAPPGPALVIAGAGSGKTRTLTYRVAYLLENGIQPENILLLTFTNKAAREMLERVTHLLPQANVGLWGGTFHSIGNRILRRHTEAAGYANGFSIMDREDQEDMLNAIIADAGIKPKEKEFPKGGVLADILSFSLNTGRPIPEVLDEKYPYFETLAEQIAELGAMYVKRKKSANCMDFDDLLEQPLRLLRARDDIAEHYRRQFQFILVDEYQDTNTLQSEFIDALAAQHKNVMVVGDDAQSIYSWRGANFRNILEFPKRYPDTKVYRIETNYRSVPEILQVANAAIAANVDQFEKNLQPARAGTSVKPAVVPLPTQGVQAQFVCQRIMELHEEGAALSEIAVLYRAHFHSMELQMELTRHGVPFQITSGLRFFEQAHVKDVAAYLKFAVNPRDEVAFKRIARLLEGVGARTADGLWAKASARIDGAKSFNAMLWDLKVPAKALKHFEQLIHTLDEIAPNRIPVSPASMLTSVIEATYDDYLKATYANYEQRREDLGVLVNYAGQYQDLAEFLDQLALVTSLDQNQDTRNKQDQDAVVLSSVHQAKGLEWKHVFVIWLSEGSFPSRRSTENREDLEEERRLFYVAVTRACDTLHLTWPQFRTSAKFGESNQSPSRFLDEVPEHLVEAWNVSW